MIERIAVLGAGTMGHGIAHAAIAGGYRTCLFDVSEGVLEAGVALIRGIAERSVRRGEITAADCQAMLARLTTTTSMVDAVQRADLIIEAVPERIEVKL